MAGRITMTPEELHEGAAFLRQRMEAMEQEVNSLKAKIDDVISRWEGAAQQSFVSQFESDMYPILRDTLPQVIEGVASELDAAAQTISDADEGLANAFRG